MKKDELIKEVSILQLEISRLKGEARTSFQNHKDTIDAKNVSERAVKILHSSSKELEAAIVAFKVFYYRPDHYEDGVLVEHESDELRMLNHLLEIV